MPDDQYDDDDLDNEDDDLDDQSPAIRQLRKDLRRTKRDARDARKLADEGDQARRELAFLRAGVDPADPKAKYFAKGYDGALDPTLIRQEAEAAGILEPPKPSAEVAAHDAANAVSAGATGGEEGDRQAEYLAAMSKAQTQNDVIAVMRMFGKEVDNIVR